MLEPKSINGIKKRGKTRIITEKPPVVFMNKRCMMLMLSIMI